MRFEQENSYEDVGLSSLIKKSLEYRKSKKQGPRSEPLMQGDVCENPLHLFESIRLS